MLTRARVSMPSLWIVSVVSIVSACASAPAAEKPTPAATPAHLDAAHATAVAKDKLALANFQLEIAHKKADDAKARKERELELAHAEIAQFDEFDAPSRTAKAHLDLTRRRDALTEQQEELAQLEMMYQKDDLADKTREIVLQRGKPRVERAKDELAIEEREAQALETKTLPRERAKLALEAEAKARDLEGAAREAEATMLERRMAVEAAEAELKAAESKADSNPGSKP